MRQPKCHPTPLTNIRASFGANPAALRTGNLLTFRDDCRPIAVTASGQVLIAAGMRALHLGTLLQTADSAPCEEEPGVVVSQWSQNSPAPISPENRWIQS